MILTGDEINKEVKKKNITIIPFNQKQINPNSYNYRISNQLISFNSKDSKDNCKIIKIPEKGFILQPNRLYLSSTYEILGSKKYAMSLIGRSSLGRLGLFLQVSANLGHTGSKHCWTLELFAAKPIKIYPNMIIGQISFWTNKGQANPYCNGYSAYNAPKRSKFEDENDINR